MQTYSQFDAAKAEQTSREAANVADAAMPMDVGVDAEALEASDWILLGQRYRLKKEAKQTPKQGANTQTVQLRLWKGNLAPIYLNLSR